MNKIKIIAAFFTLVVTLSSCEFMGLSLQEDYEYKPHTLDPHINMTVSEFLYSDVDGQLDSLISAINYTGLQAEFTQPGRTFFLMHNNAIYGLGSNGKILPNCYFNKYKVNGKPAKKWSDYPVGQVRDLLLYHIVEGEYGYDNITPDNLEVPTLLATDKGKMLLRITNDRDSKIRINDFFGSQKMTIARTSNLLATDGIIHVVGDYAEYLP